METIIERSCRSVTDPEFSLFDTREWRIGQFADHVVVHTDHTAALSLDGQPSVDLLDGDRIEVRASEHTVHFVRLQDMGYFYRNLTSRMNLNSVRETE